MNGARALRERPVWVAAISVLVTSAAWVVVVALVGLAYTRFDGFGDTLVLARALVRAMLLAVRHVMPMAAAAALVVAGVGLIASMRWTERRRQGGSHV